MLQINGQDIGVYGGCDPGPTTSWGAFLDLRDGDPQLHVGPLEFRTEGRNVVECRVGDWSVPQCPTFLLLEYPTYRGHGENRAAGRQIQLTIASAVSLELKAKLFGMHVVTMAPVNITRNMTSYYRDKLNWDRAERKSGMKRKFPHTRQEYVRNALNVNGLKCGRGTVLNSSHTQDAALALLAGMRHCNADRLLRQRVEQGALALGR